MYVYSDPNFFGREIYCIITQTPQSTILEPGCTCGTFVVYARHIQYQAINIAGALRKDREGFCVDSISLDSILSAHRGIFAIGELFGTPLFRINAASFCTY